MADGSAEVDDVAEGCVADGSAEVDDVAEEVDGDDGMVNECVVEREFGGGLDFWICRMTSFAR